ncbi:Arm DNA-binding domain-containing protein, partial [Clostridioides difficile]|nr:Arm DNA-binding domain-containing protein [Clostridioides difficile]MDN9927164.1 Arm DNA-binding domain-containing protein [Clostridioides difficile]
MKGGVRKRGKKWYYYFDAGIVDGKRKKVERVGGNTKKEAEKSLRDAINEYENAGIVFDETNMSLSDYLNFWYKEYVLL